MSGWSNSANNDVFNVHDYDEAGGWIEFEAPHYATPVAEADKTSITIKTARVFYHIGGASDAYELALTDFYPNWEAGRVFAYETSTKVATFGNGSTGGVVVPNGSNIYYPNIHVTSATGNATYGSRSLLNGNPSGTVDIDCLALSERVILYGLTNLATARFRNVFTQAFQNIYFGYTAAMAELIINGIYAGLDTVSTSRVNYGRLLSSVVSPHFDVRNIGACNRNDASNQLDIFVSNLSSPLYAFNWESIKYRNGYASVGVTFNTCNDVVLRNACLVGGYLSMDGSARVYVKNLRMSHNPSAIAVNSNHVYANQSYDTVVDGLYSIPNLGLSTGYVINHVATSQRNVVHHVDLEIDATSTQRILYQQGVRQIVAHANITNATALTSLASSSISYTDDLRYANINCDKAANVTSLSGVVYDGVRTSGMASLASNAAAVDIRSYHLFYSSAAKTAGSLFFGLMSPEASLEYFTVNSGTLGGDVYYDNKGAIFLTADGNQVTQTSSLIRGIESFDNTAATVGSTGTITLEYSLSEDGETWGSYQTLNATNLSAETLPDPDDGFYMRIRATVSGTDTTRNLIYISMPVTTDANYFPTIGWRRVQFTDMVAGSVVGVFKAGVLVGTATADANGDATIEVECLFDNVPVEYTYQVRKAGYAEVIGATEVNHLDVAIVIAQNLDRTVSAAVGGITIDGSAKTMTVTSAVDMLELYDTVQDWSEDNIEYDVPIVKTTATLFEMATDWELINEAAFDLTGYTLAGNFDLIDTGVTGGALDGYIKIDLTIGGTCTATVSGTVDYTEEGTYDCRGHVFVGTIELVNSSGGDVTVKIPIGTSYTNTGPDITVEESAAITIANANIEDDSRVQIYNVTQDTELDNSEVSGGAGYSLAATVGAGQGIEVGDTIRIRATFADGADYRENYEEFAVATTSNITFIGTQTAWTHANFLSVDGSAQTEFSTDFANVEVDTDASGNLFDVADMIGWIIYTQTTEDGIRYWYGALTSTDAANWKIATAQVDLYIDNVNAATATQGDTVILMRDDSVYPQVVPTSGGGGIGMIQSGLVFPYSGGGGSTPSEVAEAVWNETIAGKTTAANMLDSVYSVDVANEIDSAFQAPGKIDGVASRDEALHLAAAGTGAKTSGMETTTPKIRSLADDRDLVAGTVDANGNRTAITLDL
jgi:hypothetical protein